MRDLNFFEPYIEKTEFKIDKKIMYFALGMFALLSFATYSIYNSIIIKQETIMVENLRTTAENPRSLEKVGEIEEKQIEVDEFREAVEKIRYLDESIAKRDIIDEALLDKITSRMPQYLFLTSLGIYNREIQIVGIAKDKLSIAELEKGLEDLEDAEEIFISNISLEEDFYNFTINITLKDVDGNGEEAAEEELVEEEPED